jgi:hypothetical protein
MYLIDIGSICILEKKDENSELERDFCYPIVRTEGYSL